jgi:DNA-binding response OmpR family regulator
VRGTPWSRPVSWWEVDTPEWLVADEDPESREAVERLVDSRVALVMCGDGAEALWEAGHRRPSVVIVSATLPVVPAAEVAAVLSRHRAGRETVLVGVGLGEADRAASVLASGAAGVVSRPYRSQEIDRLIRSHQDEMKPFLENRAVLTVGSVRLDGPAFTVTAAGHHVPLRLREFELLRILMLHHGGVVTQAQMQGQLRGIRGGPVSANTIAVHIRHLRVRLRGVAEIVTVRGLGYRLSVTDEEGAAPPLVPTARGAEAHDRDRS